VRALFLEFFIKLSIFLAMRVWAVSTSSEIHSDSKQQPNEAIKMRKLECKFVNQKKKLATMSSPTPE